jgi:HAD superfamily hydrolase (TIGR01490 family)
MKLALFDLDHTLIPFDSGMAWTQFLAGRGVLPADAPEAYLAQCQAFVDGKIDIHAMHRANVAPLAAFAPAQLAAWLSAFEAAIAPRLPPAMRALVQRHRDRGDLCAIVTATTRFVAEPFARGFGVEQLLATEAQRGDDGRVNGEIDGLPCWREHKVAHVLAWLGPERPLASFERSWFYSDSASDLPLLGLVSDPVAVRPEPRLRSHALQHGWAVWT